MTFTGRLSVEGLAELESACVHVEGLCSVASGAELHVAHCRNVKRWGDGLGGGVFVSGDLQVDGTLEVHQSHSRESGGGVFVLGTSAQRVEPRRRA